MAKAHPLTGEVNYCYIINLTRKLLRLMRQCLLSVYKLPLNDHSNICLPQTPTCILITDSAQSVAVQDLGEHIYIMAYVSGGKRSPQAEREEGGKRGKEGRKNEDEEGRVKGQEWAMFSPVSRNHQTTRNVSSSVL